MIPIVTPEEMAAIDAAAPEPVDVLIDRAGWAVARVARRLLGGIYGKRVVVIAGRGNNGADGRVAGALLARRGAQVTVVDPAGRPDVSATDTSAADTSAATSAADTSAADTSAATSAADTSAATSAADTSAATSAADTSAATSAADASAPVTLPPADLIVDAAFGTGLSRPHVAPHPADPATPVLAVDIPSGIDGLTGERPGDPLCADVTVTFAALKPGLLCGDGPATSGEVICVDIGLDTSSARAWQVTGADVADWLPARPRGTHKWRAALRLVAGSPGMTGSADLASAAALRAGSGYVRRSTPGLDPATPGTVPTGPIEAVTTALAADGWADDVLGDIDRFGALAIGPGLGRDPSVRAQIARVLAAPIPIVIDGDGLRALGDDPAALLGARPADAPPVVLTPHEAEFAALGGDARAPDRFETVRALAAHTGAVVLRKGPTTVVAHPDGTVLVSTVGDARLATAGTGDVLTGILGAFLARGVEPFEAAAAAAWVHGAAGRLGRGVGLVASDLPDLVATVLATPGGVAMSEDGPVRVDPTR